LILLYALSTINGTVTPGTECILDGRILVIDSSMLEKREKKRLLVWMSVWVRMSVSERVGVGISELENIHIYTLTPYTHIHTHNHALTHPHSYPHAHPHPR
jgi:hypothetical protein